MTEVHAYGLLYGYKTCYYGSWLSKSRGRNFIEIDRGALKSAAVKFVVDLKSAAVKFVVDQQERGFISNSKDEEKALDGNRNIQVNPLNVIPWKTPGDDRIALNKSAGRKETRSVNTGQAKMATPMNPAARLLVNVWELLEGHQPIKLWVHLRCE